MYIFLSVHNFFKLEGHKKKNYHGLSKEWVDRDDKDYDLYQLSYSEKNVRRNGQQCKIPQKNQEEIEYVLAEGLRITRIES